MAEPSSTITNTNTNRNENENSMDADSNHAEQDQDQDQDQAEVKQVIPSNILGPPEPLKSLQIGYKLDAFKRGGGMNMNMDPNQLSNYTIERISYTPDAFVLRNFLSIEECNEIKSMANQYNMTQAETITENDTSSRKKCQVAWIPSSSSSSSSTSTSGSKSNLVSNLVSATANLLLSKSVLGHPSAGVEDLQVLKYGVGGEFVLHHDGEPRVLTVIYYLNGVGGTWIPLARTNNDENEDPCENMDHGAMEDGFQRTRKIRSPQNKAQALDLGKDFQPGLDGILVKGKGMDMCNTKTKTNTNTRKSAGNNQHDMCGDENSNSHVAWIQQGDALAFYNYCDDGSARLNWRSLHSGLPTTEEDGEKWIANHWFRVNDLADI